MTIANPTTHLEILKELYDKDGLQKLVEDKEDRPATAMLKKDTSFQGTTMRIPLMINNGAGRSASFSIAQDNSAAATLKGFDIDVVKDYAVVKITDEQIERSRGDEGSFVRSLKLENDAKVSALADSIEAGIFGDGYGSLATISGVAGSTVYVNNDGDMPNFFVGQNIVAAASTGSALRSSTAGVISALDAQNHKLTFSAAVAGTFAPQTGDTLFSEGDYTAASTAAKISGFGAWIPASAPTSGDSFFGVDRSVDAERLAGQRYTGSTSAIEDAICDAAYQMKRWKCKPDVCFISFTDYARLVKEKGPDRRYTGNEKEGSLGFAGFTLVTPGGNVRVIPALHCAEETLWLLTMSTWKLVSMGELIKLSSYNGMTEIPAASEMSRECRWVSYAQLACHNPGGNARITLS